MFAGRIGRKRLSSWCVEPLENKEAIAVNLLVLWNFVALMIVGDYTACYTDEKKSRDSTIKYHFGDIGQTDAQERQVREVRIRKKGNGIKREVS